MNQSGRPLFFYLYRHVNDIKIEHTTDEEAAAKWNKGIFFIGSAQKTMEQAIALRLAYLKKEV